MKTNTNEEQNSAPAYTACSGRIRAAVWESDDSGALRHKITVNRLFREESGAWKRGRTFYASELASLVEAVSKAQQWVQQRNRQLEFPKQSIQTDN